MKLVPVEAGDEGEGSEVIPEVPPVYYGELFHAADWAVLNRPWEEEREEPLFEVNDEEGGSGWQAKVGPNEKGVCVFSLVREGGDCLEVQFLGSDFLQGHDYDLNVRYAPDSWDECELDVIVLRASLGDGAPGNPSAEQVRLLTAGLERLRSQLEGS